MEQFYDTSRLQACGDDVRISGFVHIGHPQMVRVGSHTAIDWGFYLRTQATIGDYVHIAPYVTVVGGAEGRFVMEDFATLAAGSRVICGSDEHKGAGLVGPTIPAPQRDTVICKPVVFKRFANVGTNVVIMPGVTLGEGSVAGANSFINRDLEPWSIYLGTPARKVGERPKDKMLAYARELGY
jgi:acetyltransferase-like isoleucine patch superfamily enzyme